MKHFMYSHSIFLAKHFYAAETLQSFQASNQYNKPHTNLVQIGLFSIIV